VNHTTVTVAILVAILATFVVGISVITTTSLISSSSSTTQSAYAYNKKGHNDEDMIGNTITNQKCTENGKVIGGSGNSFQQECRPLICINPSGSAICSASQEGTGAIEQPAPVDACEACFDNLTAFQKSRFEDRLPSAFPNTGVTTIEQLCTLLRNQVSSGGIIESLNQIDETLSIVGVDQNTISNIHSCIQRALH